MLQVVRNLQARPGAGRNLAGVAMLDLTAEQVPLWNILADILGEAKHAIEAIDAIAELQRSERAPSIVDLLEEQTRRLGVRLGATRQIMIAATNLRRVLSPRQRASADRYLTAICRELGCVLPPEVLSARRCVRMRQRGGHSRETASSDWHAHECKRVLGVAAD